MDLIVRVIHRKLKCHFALFCNDCQVEVIWTQFGNGTLRFLCPKCKKRVFAKRGEYGLERAKCYSEFNNSGHQE